MKLVLLYENSILAYCKDIKKALLRRCIKGYISRHHQNEVAPESTYEWWLWECEPQNDILKKQTRIKTRETLRWLYQNDVSKSRSWSTYASKWCNNYMSSICDNCFSHLAFVIIYPCFPLPSRSELLLFVNKTMKNNFKKCRLQRIFNKMIKLPDDTNSP